MYLNNSFIGGGGGGGTFMCAEKSFTLLVRKKKHRNIFLHIFTLSRVEPRYLELSTSIGK